MGSSIHTIVIGSGISGMAAASTIARQGHEVVVLQAGSYIGGRLKSVNIPLANQTTFAFDEGASWIHGACKEHPIQHLADMVGTKLVETDDDSAVNYDLNGEDCGDKTAKAFEKYEKLVEKAGEIQGATLQNALGKIDPNCLRDKYFMYNVSSDIEFQTSGSIAIMSSQHAQDDSEYEGKEMLVTSGYQALPVFLSQDKNIKVLLNHQVVEIIREANGKSLVKCSNGESFEAPNVVISVPLGILKMNAIRFTPDIPAWKRQAINQIQFGNVCKVLIVLKGKTIDSKEHYIGVVEDDVNKRGLATYFLNLWGVAGVPALMTFGLGANADDIEAMPEPQLKELIASRFRIFADESFTADDFDIYRTYWRHNPNFRGTYSFPGINAEPKHWEGLAKPIFNCNWHFCGEHTHSKYRGTVHGAYLSGLDSADVILRNLSEDDWEYKGKEEDESEEGEKGEKEEKKGEESS